MTRLLIAIFAASVLSGCSAFNVAGSSEFSCPGMPKGISCKSTREVYKITDKEKSKKGTPDIPTYIFTTEPANNAALNPVPVLEQAKVMRVWIAPWIDRNNDQHWPGLVFTVIQPKQWHFGNEEFEGIEPPVPHKMMGKAATSAASTTNGSADMPKNEEDLLN